MRRTPTDPNNLLAEIRRIVSRQLERPGHLTGEETETLASQFEMLDLWMMHGRVLPSDWTKRPRRCASCRPTSPESLWAAVGHELATVHGHVKATERQ